MQIEQLVKIDQVREGDVLLMSDDEKFAALRFCETCDDNEGYDVSRQMMKRLAAHGLVIDKLFGRFEQTELLIDIRGELEAWALMHNAGLHKTTASVAQLGPSAEELAAYEAESAAAEAAYKKPPCQRCGAMTAEESATKCRVGGGDDDHFHGGELWPD